MARASVGLAVLITVCAVCARVHFGAEGTGSIPERGELALIACAVLIVASIAITRFNFVDRDSFLTALPVIALITLMASLPFIASGHLGIPGIGINNDMAAHLIWADWVQEQLGTAPTGIRSATRSARTGWPPRSRRRSGPSRSTRSSGC